MPDAGARPLPVAPGPMMIALGCIGVVLGGLVAAVTDPLDWTQGSWAAAYLVLVVGVGQVVMGWMRGRSDDVGGLAWLQVVGWNLGSLLVIVGTLVTTAFVVDLGSVLLVIALVLALIATRSGQASVPRPLGLLYQALLLVLAVSIPIGIVLVHTAV